MNQEQAKGIVRGMVNFGGGIAVGSGYVKAETITALLSNEAVMGLLAMLATVAWGFIARSNKNLVLAVDALPETKAIITSPEIASATPEAPTVVASVRDLPLSVKTS